MIEDSYISRFFAKFVEILAAGFATACSAYLVTQLVGPPPATVPVRSADPTAVETPKSPAVLPAPSVAAVDEQRPAPAQPAPKVAKVATSALPGPKDVKTSTATARGEKSAEALARAALASLDADRQAPADAPVQRALSAPVAAAPVEAAPRPTDLPPPRVADLPPPPAAAEVPARPLATAEPLAPNAGASSATAAPEPETSPDDFKGLLSVPKRIFGLLRPGTPSRADDAPRPPLPVGTAAGE